MDKSDQKRCDSLTLSGFLGILASCVSIMLAGCGSNVERQDVQTLGYQTGQKAARENIKDDEIIFLDPTGIRRAWTDEERRSLREEYGIEYKDGRGLGAEFVKGYNHEMSTEAVARFGIDYRSKLTYRKYPELGPARSTSQ